MASAMEIECGEKKMFSDVARVDGIGRKLLLHDGQYLCRIEL